MQIIQPFLKSTIIEKLVEIIIFFSFSRLKPNLAKCEIVVIGALKGFRVAVCCKRCTDLCNKAINILVTDLSCNSKIKESFNFLKIVSNSQCVLKLWRFWNLTRKGWTVVFNSLAMSKIDFQPLAPDSSHIIRALEANETSFV